MLYAKIKTLVDRIVNRIDYLALYSAVVKGQNDNLLEVLPDDKRIPEISGLKIKTGIPGVQIKVQNGSKVLVGFENGDPSHPYAALWEQATLVDVTLSAESAATFKAMTMKLEATSVAINAATIGLGAGKQPVARLGDMVMIPVTSLIGTPSVGQIVSGNFTVTA